MSTRYPSGSSLVSLLSPSGSAVEATALAALLVAIVGSLGRATLHFL
ncbi:MAG: hypothetical protein ABEJ34_01605 [Haloferacaceae archaeon]